MARTMTRTPPVWLSRQQAADEYGVSVRTVERWNATGRLRAYRVGGRVRIKGSDLDKLARPIASAATR